MKLIPILYQPEMALATLEGRKTQTRRTRGLGKINERPDDWRFAGTIGGNPIAFALAVSTIKLCHPVPTDKGFTNWHLFKNKKGESAICKCPYGQPGDVLWVRETFRKIYRADENGYIDFSRFDLEYAADNPEPVYEVDGDGFQVFDSKGQEKMLPFKPSIHMPYAACRQWLKVKSVRVERAQDISEADALTEGIQIITGIKSLTDADTGETVKGSGDAYKNYLDVSQVCIWPTDSFETLWIKINGQASWDANPWVWCVSFEPCEKPENESPASKKALKRAQAQLSLMGEML